MRPYFAVRTGTWKLMVVALPLLGGAACKKPQPEVSDAASTFSAPVTQATVRSEKYAAKFPASEGRNARVIETVPVPGDREVEVVAGNRHRPVVFLHGMCSEARPSVESFAESVVQYGTIVALEGDAPCPSGASWTKDPVAIDARVNAAIDAVNAKLGIALDKNETIVIGESMGASRAIALASQFPSKYRRIVLVGGPETPSAQQLARAKAVALLAGEKEPQEKMRRGATELERAGVDARFWLLPDATHGTYGSNGERIMGEVVAFVTSK